MERPDPVVAPFRRFNRFYTKLIGSLSRGYLDTPHSLQEARVIYEIGISPGCTATDIRDRVGFDQGYLSRIISRLERQHVIQRSVSPDDGRAYQLSLTKEGEETFRVLNERANAQVHDVVKHLTRSERQELVGALQTVHRLLDPAREPPPVVIREGKLGDIGRLLHRHAVVYNEDFNFSSVFETYVAKGLPVYLENQDPARDRLWVAEADGRPVGWIAIHHVDDRPGWAKLRWFLVEREARGRGLGWRLLSEAVQFSRDAGYEGIFLWTVSDLHAASHLYARAGFELVEETKDCPWADRAREQRWELRLDQEEA